MSKLFLRTTTLILAVAMLIVLAACGGGSAQQSLSSNAQQENSAVTEPAVEPSAVTIWVHPFIGDEKRAEEQNQMWVDFQTRFAEKNPGVTAKVQMIPWANRDQRMLTAFSAAQGPDVVYLIIDHLAQFGSMGIIEPLDRYITDDIKNDYLESALKSTTIDGHIFGLPVLQTATTYVYNLDLLAKAGWDTAKLPETWADMNELLKKVKAIGKIGISYDGGANANLSFFPYLWQTGGNVLDEKGNVVFDSPESISALTRVADLYKNGYLSKDAVSTTSSTALWENGEMACYFLDSGAINNYLYGATKLSFKFAVGPVLTDKEKATYGTVGSWCISKTSQVKDTAAKLILFLTDPENMKIFLDKTGNLPPKKSLSNMYESKPEIDYMVKQCLPYTRPGIVHPAGRQITTSILPAMWQAAMLGQKTPEQAIKEVIEPINKAIADSMSLKPQ